MIEILAGFPEDVLAVSGIGEISEDDYRKVLVPAVDEKMKKHKNVRLLFCIGERFKSFTAGAMWEDTKLGVSRWSHWGRIALVTDVPWIGQAARLFAPLFHHPVRVFANAEMEAAKLWIVEPEAMSNAA
jgi:SpoIIAA-like